MSAFRRPYGKRGGLTTHVEGNDRVEAQEAGADRVAPGLRLVYFSPRVRRAVLQRGQQNPTATSAHHERTCAATLLQWSEMRQLTERF